MANNDYEMDSEMPSDADVALSDLRKKLSGITDRTPEEKDLITVLQRALGKRLTQSDIDFIHTIRGYARNEMHAYLDTY